MGASFGEFMISRVEAADTNTERLENKVRVMLDELLEHVQLPFGVNLEGVITNDRHGNKSLYVFLKDRDGKRYPGRDLRWNDSPDQIDEAKGGKWISLNDRGLNGFNAKWEARDLKQAVKHFEAGIFTAEEARRVYQEEQDAERIAFRAKLDAQKEQES